MGGTGEGGGEQGSWGERRDREKASSSSALLLPHHLKLSKVLFSFPITFSPLWLNRELLGGGGEGGTVRGSGAGNGVFSRFPQILPQFGPILWLSKLRAEGSEDGDPPALITSREG